MATLVSPRLKDSTTALYGGSILNEFFRNGDQQVIEFLVTIRTSFPNAVLIVGDYYGKLGTISEEEYQLELRGDNNRKHHLLHDVVQAVSGQGIPCKNREEWERLYLRAGNATL